MKTTTSGSETQQRNVDTAVRLMRLSAGNTRAVIELLGALALALLDLNEAEARALASAADPEQAMRVRVQHTHAAARLMLESARRMVDLGNEARIAFSRLLTEQLASGNHELMDAFQSFFNVLPLRNADLVTVFRLALDRTERSLLEIDAVLGLTQPRVAKQSTNRRRGAAKRAMGDAAEAKPMGMPESAAAPPTGLPA